MLERKCDSYGFTKGSDAYSQCLMQMDMQAKSDNQRAMDNAAASLQRTGDQMRAQGWEGCASNPTRWGCPGYRAY